MSTPDKVYVGRKLQRLESSPDYGAYSKVILWVDENTCVEAGNDTGLVLEAKCPWATQETAQNVLAQLDGFRYRPYTADGALIEPAAELGDAITTNGIYSGIYTMARKLGAIASADVSAPSPSEADHEIQYESAGDREFSRKMRDISSQFAIQAQQIEAKVSSINNSDQSFGWLLTSESMKWYAGTTWIMELSASGLTVSGTVNATAGNIGGCEIANGSISINGSKLQMGTVTGGTYGAIGSGTITSGNTSFPTSLTGGQGYYDSTNNISHPNSFWTKTLRIGDTGTQCGLRTFTFVDGNGTQRTINYIGPVVG